MTQSEMPPDKYAPATPSIRRKATQIALLIASASLVACGGGGGTTSPSNDTPSPAPVATNPDNQAAPNIHCGVGYGQDLRLNVPNLEVYPTAYYASTLSAGQPVDVEILANVSFISTFSRFISGPLRLELWAIPQGGTVSAGGFGGHLIFRKQMTTVGGAGPNADQMENDSHVTAYITGKGTNPPAGEYCYLVALQMQFDRSVLQCGTPDNYCPRGWYMFKEGNRVQ